MIGKMIIGKGFGGCIAYCLEDKKIKENATQKEVINRAEVILYNKCYGDKKELVQQFNDVRSLNAKQSKPVLHITLSMAPGEMLIRQLLADIVLYCAQELGFADNQFLAVQHNDTKHQHIHIVANRIGFNGKTNVSDSNSYKRIAAFCRKMEIKYNLQEVLSPKTFLPKEQQLIPRADQRKNAIKTILQQALKEAKSFENFSSDVKAKGLQMIKGRGISFIDNKGVKIKGSDMGLSLQTINKQIELNNNALKQTTQYINLSQRKQSLHL